MTTSGREIESLSLGGAALAGLSEGEYDCLPTTILQYVAEGRWASGEALKGQQITGGGEQFDTFDP